MPPRLPRETPHTSPSFFSPSFYFLIKLSFYNWTGPRTAMLV